MLSACQLKEAFFLNGKQDNDFLPQKEKDDYSGDLHSSCTDISVGLIVLSE
jgi:hypothetical protein